MVDYVKSVHSLPSAMNEICQKKHDVLQTCVNSIGPFVLNLNETDCVAQTDNMEKSVGVVSNDVYGSVRPVCFLLSVCVCRIFPSLSGVS